MRKIWISNEWEKMEHNNSCGKENIEIGQWTDMQTYDSYKKEHDHYSREIASSSMWKKILTAYVTAWTIGASAYMGVNYMKFEDGVGPLANTGIEWSRDTQKDCLGFMGSMFGLTTVVMYLSAAKIYAGLYMSEKSDRSQVKSLEKKMKGC